jgi:creatinine amidohydrolase
MELEWMRVSEADVAALRRRTGGVALLPLGSLESHGPHLPLGSDPIALRLVVRRAVELEPAAVMPELPYSFVLEATRRPGAIHIESGLLMDFVEAICDELARNGFRKIVLVHGHGGNVALHWMLCKRILERDKPYAAYSITPMPDMHEFILKLMTSRKSRRIGHACEMETSLVLAADPALVNLGRLKGRTFEIQPAPEVASAYTTVDWVSRWPEMAVGDPSAATRAKGERILEEWARRVADVLRRVKRDRITRKVMREFSRERRQGGTLRRYGAGCSSR